MKIRHWKTQLDTTKDTLIRINIQKQNRLKIFGGGVQRYLPLSGYRENKRYHKEIWKECTERKAEDGQSI